MKNGASGAICANITVLLDMVSALKGKPTYPRIPIKENDMKSFSVAAAFSPEKCRKKFGGVV